MRPIENLEALEVIIIYTKIVYLGQAIDNTVGLEPQIDRSL